MCTSSPDSVIIASLIPPTAILCVMVEGAFWQPLNFYTYTMYGSSLCADVFIQYGWCQCWGLMWIHTFVFLSRYWVWSILISSHCLKDWYTYLVNLGSISGIRHVFVFRVFELIWFYAAWKFVLYFWWNFCRHLLKLCERISPQVDRGRISSVEDLMLEVGIACVKLPSALHILVIWETMRGWDILE